MNIVMLTNTYSPHVGGVARSIDAFAHQYRQLGHKVLIVAPEFDNTPAHEQHVVRIPALQHFNGSDFSVVLPVSGLLTDTLNEFAPDVIHSHHPFLLGMTALRIARFRKLPLVFTHHTLYEQYTHYVPGDSNKLKHFVIELATQYANLANAVFAPSESVASLLQGRGVNSPIHIVPTGVELERFQQGNGDDFRQRMGIPKDAFLVGHLGRLAPEKNLDFLAQSVARFIKQYQIKQGVEVHFLVVGQGPSENNIREILTQAGLSQCLHIAGIQTRQQLANAYHAMDVFAFASNSETQGMVLTEAMAAGKAVVALDAPGAREVVQDGVNGRLLQESSTAAFADALEWVAQQPTNVQHSIKQAALATAKQFSMPNTAAKALHHYQQLCASQTIHSAKKLEAWEHLRSLISAEWEIIEGVAKAASASLLEK